MIKLIHAFVSKIAPTVEHNYKKHPKSVLFGVVFAVVESMVNERAATDNGESAINK